MKVLIVEDDVSVTEVIANGIEDLNHGVETALTGEDTLKKVKKKRFDLVLLDLYLPDCRGYELIPQLKGLWPQIGIVTMTGYNSRELEMVVREHGVIYYMIKPFRIKVVKEILEHISNMKGVRPGWVN